MPETSAPQPIFSHLESKHKGAIPINIYQVVRRGTMWHVHMPDATSGVQPSTDRLAIVSWACETAKIHNGTVQVRDIGGAIEIIYSYVDGVEHVKRILAATR